MVILDQPFTLHVVVHFVYFVVVLHLSSPATPWAAPCSYIGSACVAVCVRVRSLVLVFWIVVNDAPSIVEFIELHVLQVQF